MIKVRGKPSRNASNEIRAGDITEKHINKPSKLNRISKVALWILIAFVIPLAVSKPMEVRAGDCGGNWTIIGYNPVVEHTGTKTCTTCGGNGILYWSCPYCGHHETSAELAITKQCKNCTKSPTLGFTWTKHSCTTCGGDGKVSYTYTTGGDAIYGYGDHAWEHHSDGGYDYDHCVYCGTNINLVPWSHTVAYNANASGVANMPTNFTKTTGQIGYINSAIPTRVGYGFKGWISSNGMNYHPGDAYGYDQNGGTITLTAQWGAAPSVTNAYTYYNSSTGRYIIYLRVINEAYPASAQFPTWSDVNGQDDIVWEQAVHGSWTVNGVVYNYGIEIPLSQHNGTAYSQNAHFYIDGICLWTSNYTIQHSLNFHANGGSCSTASKTVYYSTAIGSLPTPTRTGYTFLGWYTAASGGSQVDAGTSYWLNSSSGGNATIYAHWKINAYTVTYNYSRNGGTSVSQSSATIDYGSAINLNVTASKTDYIFIGWNTDPDAKESIASMNIGAGNVTLYAIYSIPVSDVKEVYLQTWTESDPENYKTIPLSLAGTSARGYTYSLASINLKSGYSSGAEVKSRLAARDNATNWRVIKNYTSYTVPAPMPDYFVQSVNHYKYDVALKDWVLFDTTSEYVVSGTTYTPSYVTAPDGFKQDHIDGAYVVTEAKTSNAYYTPYEYTLYFDANGGTCNTDSKVVTYGDLYGELPVPVREGYSFTGWYTASINGTRKMSSDVYEVAGDSMLFAHWTINTYKVTYDFASNGGTSCTIGVADAEYGSQINLSPIAAKNDWEFIGWNTDSKAVTGINSMTMPNKDVTLYAIYKRDITATFIDTKETRNVTGTIYNNTKSLEITAPIQNEYDGWSLSGWTKSLSAEAIADVGNGGSCSISENTMFYGLYERTITAQYDSNGLSWNPSSVNKKQYYNANGDITTPQITLEDGLSRSDYSFKAWQDSNTEIEYAKKSKVSLSKDVIFKAIWDKIPEIEAYDRVFSLTDAQAGKITEEELLKSATGTDLEDGILVKGTGLVIKDSYISDFASVTSDMEETITYLATDSFGNTSTKTITVKIVDDTMKDSSKTSYVRFIGEDFYKNQDGTYISNTAGGLELNSEWKLNDTYSAKLDSALSNKKTNQENVTISLGGKTGSVAKANSGEWNTTEQSWTFSQEDIRNVKEYIANNRYSKYGSEEALEKFVKTFGSCQTE